MTLPPLVSKNAGLQTRQLWAVVVVLIMALGIAYLVSVHDASPAELRKEAETKKLGKGRQKLGEVFPLRGMLLIKNKKAVINHLSGFG